MLHLRVEEMRYQLTQVAVMVRGLVNWQLRKSHWISVSELSVHSSIGEIIT